MGWHSAPRVVALLAAILALFPATKFIKLFHALQDKGCLKIAQGHSKPMFLNRWMMWLEVYKLEANTPAGLDPNQKTSSRDTEQKFPAGLRRHSCRAGCAWPGLVPTEHCFAAKDGHILGSFSNFVPVVLCAVTVWGSWWFFFSGGIRRSFSLASPPSVAPSTPLVALKLIASYRYQAHLSQRYLKIDSTCASIKKLCSSLLCEPVQPFWACAAILCSRRTV